MATNGIRRRVLLGISIALVFLGLVGIGWWWNTRPTWLAVEAPLPTDFPENGFSHRSFEALLEQFVDRCGRVDYARWHKDGEARRRLDSYLAAVALYSPENTPTRFPTREDVVGYWLAVYNAAVVKAILEHWPLESVRDVKAPVEIVRGLGFFLNQRFIVGGRAYSLYAIEHDKILADDADPRVHFVMNCGSEGCPVLRPELPTGQALEAHLAGAAREFVADASNVRIDAERRIVHLSAIFDWYRDDFLRWLRGRGVAAPTLLDYVESVAPEELRPALGRARAENYGIVFTEYDWSLNAAR